MNAKRLIGLLFSALAIVITVNWFVIVSQTHTWTSDNIAIGAVLALATAWAIRTFTT